MSITMLLEKYDVSTEEGLQKALNEIEKEEAEVDEALSGALSRSCALEGRLRAASQAYTKLGEVKSDAQAAADMVDRTATLAQDVSAKVRQLDLARSRVAECQRRVHDLIDLQLCSAGVEAAIKAQDYETGAAHVSRFLSMDPGSVAAARARGAPDPRDDMARAAVTLRDLLVQKFEEAARKEDEAAIDRLFKLFPQLGRADEGVDLLAKYLAKQLGSTMRRTCSVEGSAGQGAAFADAMTRWVEAGGAALERARVAAAAAAARGRFPRALTHLQPIISEGARRVGSALVAARASAATGALAAEPALADLALTHSRLALYLAFVRRKTEVDAEGLPEATRAAALASVERTLADSDLVRTAHDVLAQYLTLERYFLEESINKALKVSQTADSSSLVDDVFFIARKVIGRAVSTGSADGVCAVLNEVGAALERPVADTLRRALRVAPAQPLPLALPTASAGPPQPPPAHLDAQRRLFLSHMNEAEAGAEWAERLATEAVAAAEGAGLTRGSGGAGARARLQSCAGGLSGAAAAFRAAHDAAAAALHAELLAPAHAWAEHIVAPTADPEEMVEDADALPAALEELWQAAGAALSARAAEAAVASVVGAVAARAEREMLRHMYTRASAAGVERRARRLAAWSGACAGVRERCARLTQAAALLALDAVRHAPAALLPAPRLEPARVSALLSRRVDFKMEDIKKLKL